MEEPVGIERGDVGAAAGSAISGACIQICSPFSLSNNSLFQVAIVGNIQKGVLIIRNAFTFFYSLLFFSGCKGTKSPLHAEREKRNDFTGKKKDHVNNTPLSKRFFQNNI